MHSIDRNVVVLGWVSFFTDMASAMVNPILPIFVVSILHEDMDKLGIIVAVATFVSYLLRLFSGYIADRYGIVKPLVVSGYALSALSKPLIGFSHSYKSVTALKAVERVGKGLRSAPKDLMIAKYSKKNASGQTFGFHKMLDIAGELSGTLILFGLLWYYGQTEEVIRMIFYMTLIPGLVGLILVSFFLKDIKREKKHIYQKFKLTKKDKRTIHALFYYFFFIFFLFNDAFFTMQAKNIGISVLYIPLLFIISSAIQTLVSYPLGILTDKAGEESILLFAYISGITAQLLLLFREPHFTWAAYAFLGLFTVSSLNANRSLIAKHADNKGAVYGVFYGAVALFGAVGAYLCGTVWHHFGMYDALLFSLGGTMIVFLFFSIHFFRKKIQNHQVSPNP